MYFSTQSLGQIESVFSPVGSVIAVDSWPVFTVMGLDDLSDDYLGSSSGGRHIFVDIK